MKTVLRRGRAYRIGSCDKRWPARCGQLLLVYEVWPLDFPERLSRKSFVTLNRVG